MKPAGVCGGWGMLPGPLPTPTHSFYKGDTTPSLVVQALFKRLELGGLLCPQQAAIDPIEHPGLKNNNPRSV